MASSEESGADSTARQEPQPPLGGRSARGPAADPAGSVDAREVQPSEGRTGGGDRGTGLAEEGAAKAFDAANAGPPGPGPGGPRRSGPEYPRRTPPRTPRWGSA